MITGVVTASREAGVQVMVRGAHSRDVPVDAVIDTGCTGFLTLPPPLITILNLAFAGTTRATLGDGSAVSMDVFEATVVWDNHDCLVTVLAA